MYETEANLAWLQERLDRTRPGEPAPPVRGSATILERVDPCIDEIETVCREIYGSSPSGATVSSSCLPKNSLADGAASCPEYPSVPYPAASASSDI